MPEGLPGNSDKFPRKAQKASPKDLGPENDLVRDGASDKSKILKKYMFFFSDKYCCNM